MRYFLTFSLLCSIVLSIAQPSYDDCSNAIDLGIAPFCDGSVFSNIDATPSTISSNPSFNIPSCWNNTDNDVWLQFTTPPDGSILDFEITVAGISDGPNTEELMQPQIAVYRGACMTDGLAELACISSGLGQTAVQLVLEGLTPGYPYFLRINDYSATAAPNWGDFQVCIDSISYFIEAGISEDSICAGQSVQLSLAHSNDFTLFSWSPAELVNDPSIAEPIAEPQNTTTFTVTAIEEGTNLIINGDFEQGNSDFQTDYIFGPSYSPVGQFGVLSEEGTYTVIADPNEAHSHFASCSDHTSGTGNMLLVNGSYTPNESIWCQSVPVQPNTDYLFSAWVNSVVLVNPAVLQFSINGNLLDVPLYAPFGTCTWTEFTAFWNSGANNTAEICISNQNTEGGGNDFALDDIFFRTFKSITDTVTVHVSNPQLTQSGLTNAHCTGICNGAVDLNVSGGFISNDYQIEWNNGSSAISANDLCGGAYSVTLTDDIGCTDSTSFFISEEEFSVSLLSLSSPCQADPSGSAQVFTNGGTTPYIYDWDNGENTEIAVDLNNGLHEVTVTDANGCNVIDTIDISFDTIGFVVNISASSDTICFGENATLTGSGSAASSYQWSTGGNDQSIIVSPETTTTYSLSAIKNGDNIIVNGGFEDGNVAFESDYALGTGGTWGPISNEGTFGISANPGNLHSNFENCVDHTSGAGNMIVFNGSTIANENLWCQIVTVAPNTDYMFSTWVATVVPQNPAVLQFSINGLLLETPFSVTINSCEWQQFFTIWNSGDNTSAQICVVNQNINLSGNDFALDDISMIPVCESQDEITIVVSNPLVEVDFTNPDCFGNAGMANVNTSEGILPFTYLWSTGDNSSDIFFETSGEYTVTATDAVGCEAVTSFISPEMDFVELVIDSFFHTTCDQDNGSIYLSAINGSSAYRYSLNGVDFSKISSYFDLPAGDYEIVVQDSLGCSDEAPVVINSSAMPEVSISAMPDTLLCEEEVTLSVEEFFTYLWSEGSITQNITITETGAYSVTITDADGCIAEDMITISDCGMYDIPNAFTPDGDGVNDTFSIVSKGNIELLELKIFSRWGEVVHDAPTAWDGRYNGKPFPSEVLIYVLKVKTPTGVEMRSGDLTLIR
ncbi:MAG: T9SS type B sorting domain-containing protein [Bacteroidetes bacterium]|nr:T9SS type B sorting domain-containing protein [Bacteroidota bacterium]